MGYQDKSILCSDCGSTFTFSANEQELFASRGYTNEPKRCQECRQAKKTQRFSTTRREQFPATCSQCGKDTQVPFEPRQGRPVYCSDCYTKIKTER